MPLTKMGGIALWTFFQIIFLVSGQSNINLLTDLIYTDYLPTSTLITCNEKESVNLTKTLSRRLQRLFIIHSADESLMKFSLEPQSFVLDLQCPQAANVLQQAEDLMLFTKPFQWILLGDGVTNNDIYKSENFSEIGESWPWPFLETLTLLTDSDVKIVEKISDERFIIMEAYKLWSNHTLIKKPLAEWTSNKSLVFLNSKIIPSRRWNLQGLHMPSTTVISTPDSLNHLEDLVDTEVDTTTKVCFNMVKILGDMLNLSMSFKIETDYGVLKNGSWTGMTGDLQKKEIEITAAPLFFRQSRMSFLEYYSSVTSSRAKFLFLAPPLSYSRNIFALPFDTIVWSCCFSMLAISCCFLYAALNHEKKQNQEVGISFSEIVVFNIGAICLQGTVADTKNPPGRIFTLFLYLSYMFLYISYSACIVAILQSPDTSIQTLSDFLKSSLKAGADDKPYVRYYFQITDGDVHKAIYNTKIAPKGEKPHFLSVIDGVKEVRKGFYGFHVETSLGYREIQKIYTEEEKCGLQELKESFFLFPEPFLVMRKGTPFAEHFKIGMRKNIERGMKTLFIRRYYTKKPQCTAKTARFVSVGIVDCYYAFMLLICGLFTAFSILILEISHKKYSKNHGKLKHLKSDDFTPDMEFIN